MQLSCIAPFCPWQPNAFHLGTIVRCTMQNVVNRRYSPLSPQVADSQKDTGSNHAVSALKFGIIRRFLELGWAVLLSDVDVCVLHDPFMHLYRCAMVLTVQI